MQADDAHVPVLAELRQCLVAGNDGLRPAGNRAFQDAIIGLVADDMQPPPRPDQDTQSRQEHGDMREFLRGAAAAGYAARARMRGSIFGHSFLRARRRS